MTLPQLEISYPETVVDACRLLEAGSEACQAIAGGTDLLMSLKDGQKQPDLIVDLWGVPGLSRIEYDPGKGLQIGALVTLGQLIRNRDVLSHYPVLAQAAGQVGSVQLQGMATIGGNLCQDSCCVYFNRPEEVRLSLPPCHKLGGNTCHVVPSSADCWAPYTGDLAPVLMALGGTVTVAGRNGEKVRPIAEIFTGDGSRPVDLGAGRLITKIMCPSPARHSGAVYFKLRPRETLDYAVVGVAVSLSLNAEDSRCEKAAVILTGVGRAPLAVAEAEELKGRKVTAEAIERIAKAATKLSHPVKSVSGTEPGYRRNMVKVHVERGLSVSLEAAMASIGDGT